MKKQIIFACLIALAVYSSATAGGILADHNCISQFESIPPATIGDITSGFKIY